MKQEDYTKIIEKIDVLKSVVEDKTEDKEARKEAIRQIRQEEQRIHRNSKDYSFLNISKMITLRKIQKKVRIKDTVYKELGMEKEYIEYHKQLKEMQRMSKYYRQQRNITVLIVMMLLMYLSSTVVGRMNKAIEDEVDEGITFNEFITAVDKGDIESLAQISTKRYLVTYKEGKGLEDMTEEEKEKNENIRTETIYRLDDPTFEREMLEKGVDILISDSQDLWGMLASLLSLLFYVFIFYFIYKQIIKGALNVGQGNISKTNVDHITTTLKDVAGMTEEKEEILAAIKSMQSTEDYLGAGIEPVKGILLEGPPGTGKTLIAKSIAGEMGLPFLSYSGSEFVEMYVGMGASRVRAMYKEARKQAPCIVFIDEIDSFCGKRVASGSGVGGQQETERTMMELLNQMDGMIDNSGIFMMAATNRSDNLDTALLRPGRFDKIIHIGIPKRKEDREAIVQVHIENKRLAEGLTVEEIAVLCYGLSGAEIASVMNDAALDSLRDKRAGVIEKRDIESATMKLFAKGLAKGKHSKADMRRVAIHELGHALMNEGVGRTVIKISVQPYSSGVGGVTVVDGEQAGLQGLRTRQDLEDDLKVLYAGKVAEELFLGDCSVGASNDLERATDVLATYVGMVGMGNHNMSYTRLIELGLKNVEGSMLEEMQEISTRVYEEVHQYIKEYKADENKNRRFNMLLEHLEDEGTIYNLDKVLTKSKISDKLDKEQTRRQ